MSNRPASELARDELHSELLARNAFRVTMVGFVAFLVACCYVLLTP